MKKIRNLQDRLNPGTQQMTGSPYGTRPRMPASPQWLPLWCSTCGTDKHLMLHSVESLPAHPVEPLVHVIYACTACGSFHAHAAPFRHVAALLNEAGTVPGTLHFGGSYLHCGVPMAVTGTSYRTIQAPMSTAECPDAGTAEVILGTKTLECACGFRIELPD
ncbi:hypothetical protein [Arthrobacter celericrescens]|uniref:hypothetical protein n=1 Tax=Arthrobacter celericrescens TaxID=2320851 RepID=UPI000EA102B0|nr:hypothetical protein [Arthrobacter celericrescens]